MKKLGFLLIFVFLLAGCDIGGLSDKLTKELLSSSTSEETSKRSTDSSGEESVESESVIENNELFSSTQKASDNENLEELLLVPQADEIKKGLTVETDETLALLERYVKQNPDMGYENDVTIVYTGETYGETPNLAGIFFIINRTDTAMEDIQFTYTFGKSDSELIFDKQSFKLAADSFGVLEPNTVMPLYLLVDPSKEPLLEEININQVVEKIESFDYTTATSLEQPDSTNESATEPNEANLSLVIPKQNADKGQTFDNNPLMAQFKQLVLDSPYMGFDNDVTVMYSGLYDENDTNTLAYFFVINKTDIAMKNIQYKLSYGNKNGEMVWDQKYSILEEEVFGPLEPNAVLPLTMTVPKEKTDLFFSIMKDDAAIRLDEFKYEKLN
ncbi:hypothetical protein CAT7_02407 [Carnobacterium sp. AT7]|uniref:hypothetical protein n=1 Tax=Carnobacterium TaxID=2747 RepID=UPI00015F19C0|nr:MULTISPECIES: hypothetical protein [Carnobacterium]EDP67578.1 hypothetical protein CAT7_02407 [Carnobacterium sp. AT7]